MGVKRWLSGLGKALIRHYGSEIEKATVSRIDRIDSIAHVLIDRGAEQVKRQVKKRISKQK